MANALRLYVAELPEEECRAIHAEAAEWERTGSLRDGVLRHHTNEWVVAAGLDRDHPRVMWMRDFVSEVWRRFALPAMEQSGTEMLTANWPRHGDVVAWLLITDDGKRYVSCGEPFHSTATATAYELRLGAQLAPKQGAAPEAKRKE